MCALVPHDLFQKQAAWCWACSAGGCAKHRLYKGDERRGLVIRKGRTVSTWRAHTQRALFDHSVHFSLVISEVAMAPTLGWGELHL